MFAGHRPPTPATNWINGACDFKYGEWLHQQAAQIPVNLALKSSI
jgi:hypothetical protein